MHILILSVIKCNTEDIYRSSCPSSTKCVENPPGIVDGICLCKEEGYTFNPKYTSVDDYCTIFDANIKQNRSNSISSEAPPYEEKLKSIAHPHHIVAGILIPLVLVTIVILIILAFKKLHIIYTFRRTHRSPFYEDVVLNVEDLHDEPPLI